MRFKIVTQTHRPKDPRSFILKVHHYPLLRKYFYEVRIKPFPEFSKLIAASQMPAWAPVTKKAKGNILFSIQVFFKRCCLSNTSSCDFNYFLRCNQILFSSHIVAIGFWMAFHYSITHSRIG